MTTKSTAEERAKERFPERHPGIPARCLRNEALVDETVDRGMRKGFATCIREEVEPLEAISASLTEENAKLRDLLQELVNDMRRLRIEFGNRTGTTTQVGIASLESAKEQGFVPTNTQDNG